MDKRAAAVLGVIFGGLFLVLFAFLFLAYSAVKGGGLRQQGQANGANLARRVAVCAALGQQGMKRIDVNPSARAALQRHRLAVNS